MTTATATPAITELHLSDYTPPTHCITQTQLTVELISESNVVVTSTLTLCPNSEASPSTTLTLNGASATAADGAETPTMELLSISLNGKPLSTKEYTRTDDGLTLHQVPLEAFTLSCQTRINPQANRSLNGLYTSNGKFTTQCESQGFRNITFYLDRPDVMSEFTTTIIAPQGRYPQLLSNGNLIQRETLGDGREQAVWHDPHKKPCYLFALVAGDFAQKSTQFTTRSGRKVDIHFYVDHGDESKVDHAMGAILRAMKWDEERFGREYDLDLFQIVAVNDFNFGAMENKGLNIFNSTAILADPKTATDTRYEYIDAVVGHEYFHNWSGNRVTCKNWFQLCLKEGFTVFRDSEFTADHTSRALKRIDDVTGMRTTQFPEDGGAMAHPIRPSSVGSIENFYTATVYEKGAEVIRMIHTLLGEEAFRKGSDLYFERHDGQAVTTEDFVKAMSNASGVDLSQFEATWYNQAGTPTLEIHDEYNSSSQTYSLTIQQSTPATPGQPNKAPFHIPIRIGLLDAHGQDMPLNLAPEQQHLLSHGDTLHLKASSTTFVFHHVPQKPIPSLLRNWSAPVKLNYNYSLDDLAFLMSSDNDSFNQWEAGQKLSIEVLKSLVAAHQQGKELLVDPRLIQAFKKVLENTSLDKALIAKTIGLPSAAYLAELYPDGAVDVDAIDAARKHARATIGQALEPILLEGFHANRSTEARPYAWNVPDVAERSYKNTCLSYLISANPKKHLPLAIQQYQLNHNMTDVRSALGHILNHGSELEKAQALQAFYDEHRDNPQAINQWFTDQALADHNDVLADVRALEANPSYDGKNPNCVRSLVGGFTSNTVHFHAKDGSGYSYLADAIVAIDTFNPMLAAGLAKKLASGHRYDGHRQNLINNTLSQLLPRVHSPNTKEIVSKSLETLSSKMTSCE